jgi:hypothetical protein
VKSTTDHREQDNQRDRFNALQAGHPGLTERLHTINLDMQMLVTASQESQATKHGIALSHTV